MIGKYDLLAGFIRQEMVQPRRVSFMLSKSFTTRMYVCLAPLKYAQPLACLLTTTRGHCVLCFLVSLQSDLRTAFSTSLLLFPLAEKHAHKWKSSAMKCRRLSAALFQFLDFTTIHRIVPYLHIAQLSPEVVTRSRSVSHIHALSREYFRDAKVSNEFNTNLVTIPI